MNEHHNEENKSMGLVSRFKKFMQRNQHDNLNYRTGWHERLLNIYLTYEKLKSNDTEKLRTWKKYPDKK